MRRVLLALVVAGLLAIPSSVGAKLSGAGAVDEVARDEFSRFLDDFFFPAPVPSTPVDDVHTVDPIEGETFPPENAPFPNAKPAEWGFVRIEGDPGVLGPLFGTGATTFTTPSWDEAQETLDDLFLVFVHTEGAIDSGVFPGFNFNFDVAPDVFGAKLDNSSTPGDCAIDGFLDPDEPSVTTSVVSPGSTEFTLTEAPLFLRTFPDGAFFAFPPTHPCAEATGIAPATYVLAGPQLVEHELVGPNGPFLPITAPTIEVVNDTPAPGDGEGGVDSGTATVSADEKGDDGVSPLLILGGALAAGGLAYGGVRLVQGRRGTNEWVHSSRYILNDDDFGDLVGDRADGVEHVPTARDPWAILRTTPGVLTHLADPATPPPELDPETAARIKAHIDASFPSDQGYLDALDAQPTVTLTPAPALDDAALARISAYIDSLVPPVPPDQPTPEEARAGLDDDVRERLIEFLNSIDATPAVESLPPAPAPPVETPPSPEPQEKDLLETLERHRRAHRERTGEELSPEAESAYLGHLLDDQDHRDLSERATEAYETPVSGDRPKPPRTTPGDAKPAPGPGPGPGSHPDPASGEGSVLDDIDESGPPPGLV